MRENILDAAEQIVQEKGLDAVSFQQLATAVGLSKASVFHHFKNSDALAAALIERCRSKYGAEYHEIEVKQKTAPKKLRRIAKSFDKGLKNNQLCLLAALGSSYQTLSLELKAELGRSADGALTVFTNIFEQGRNEGTLDFRGSPATAAASFLALLQGMQHLSRYTQDPDVFMKSVENYLRNIES